jgi:hypothetical protein
MVSRVDEPGEIKPGEMRAPAQHLEQATCLKCIHLLFPVTLTAAYSRQTPLPVEAPKPLPTRSLRIPGRQMSSM